MRRHVFIVALVACQASLAWGQSEAQWAAIREQMVRQIIVGGGIKHPGVVQAMRITPRHQFVNPQQRQKAYLDMALPIGDQQTISSPYIVAYMTQTLDPRPEDKVLEIGTGSGYQAAVLSPLVREVYTVEIVEPLGERAQQTLKQLGYQNVFVKIGDGFEGWAEQAPFDSIIVTCSPETVPKPLVEQLKEGGRMVIPVGERYQQTLYLFRKQNGRLKAESLTPTLFVPMTGEAETNRRKQPDPLKPQIVNGDFEQEPLKPSSSASVEAAASPGAAADPTGAAAGQPAAPPGAQAPEAAGGGQLPVPASADEGPFVPGWYYQRQARLQSDIQVPSGKQCVVFHNAELGRESHLMQGFAIDGSQVKRLYLSVWTRGQDLQPGPTVDTWPNVIVTFYDDQRREVGLRSIGPWRGTYDWQQKVDELRVPLGAQEAILRIGLFGAVGTLAVDKVEVSAEPIEAEAAANGQDADRPRRTRRSRRERTAASRAAREAGQQDESQPDRPQDGKSRQERSQ